jgi:hypothetical protein
MNHKKIFVYSMICFLSALFLIAATPIAETFRQSHCYSLLSPINKNVGGSSEIIESACFDTFSEAIQAATKSRVLLDPSIRPENITETMLNNVEGIDLDAVQVVIGIDWDYSNYGGSTYTWVVSNYGCSDTIQYSVSSMPSGWNDRVSSAKGYSNCSFYHYQNTNFGGSSVVCNPNCSSMGALDNSTSSERWIVP